MTRLISLVFNVLLALALIAFTVEQVWSPNSWWIEIRKIYIPDFYTDDPPPVVAFDQTVHRAFIAHFYFDVRRLGPAVNGKPDLSRFSYFCSGEGELSFKPGADPAASANLDWWTRSHCPKTWGPGSYYAQLILQWRDYLSARSLTMDSSVWTVDLPPVPPPIIPPPQIIVQKPVTNVTQQVTKTVVAAAKCVPSLIPYVECPPRPRHRRGLPHRRVR
jgi:hypothetical protein